MVYSGVILLSGFVALSFLLPAVSLSYQSEILTTQIKMLQLADYVDSKNHGDSVNT